MSEKTKRNKSERGPRRMIAIAAAGAVLAVGACGADFNKEKPESRVTEVTELVATLKGLEHRLKPDLTTVNGTHKFFYSVKPLSNPDKNASERWNEDIIPGRLFVHSDDETISYGISRMYEGRGSDEVVITLDKADNSVRDFVFAEGASDGTPVFLTGAELGQLTGEKLDKVNLSINLANIALGTFQADSVYINNN